MGKTAFLFTIASNVAMRGRYSVPVGIITFGSNKIEATNHLLSSEAEISFRAFEDGSFCHSDIPRLGDAVEVLKNTPIYINSRKSMSLQELNENITYLAKDKSVRVVVLDDIENILFPKGATTGNAPETFCRMLKDIAEQLQITIITSTSQPINAQSCPENELIKYSDVVTVINRNCAKTTADKLKKGLETKLIIAKNNCGKTGVVELLYYPQYMKFK